MEKKGMSPQKKSSQEVIPLSITPLACMGMKGKISKDFQNEFHQSYQEKEGRKDEWKEGWTKGRMDLQRDDEGRKDGCIMDEGYMNGG